MTTVANVRQMLEDGSDLEVAIARQDSVGVASQLAGHARKVADLDPREVLGREVGEILKLARAGVLVEQVEAHPDVPRIALCDEGERRVQARAELRPLLEF